MVMGTSKIRIMERQCRLAHTDLAERALILEAERLLQEGIVDTFEDGLRVAAATLDGAGDRSGSTVESVQTCTDLGRRPVRGLSCNDRVTVRLDEGWESAEERNAQAESGGDDVEAWLRANDPKYMETKNGWGRF